MGAPKLGAKNIFRFGYLYNMSCYSLLSRLLPSKRIGYSFSSKQRLWYTYSWTRNGTLAKADICSTYVHVDKAECLFPFRKEMQEIKAEPSVAADQQFWETIELTTEKNPVTMRYFHTGDDN
jgi:hypothetical protein